MRNWIAAAWLATMAMAGVASADERPNVIVIVVDDMGFSDLGCYGSEIDTPRLDKLAADGLRFTQFYNCAKCETTRACLLSGRYHGEVGVGKLENCVTIAEVLRGAGYHTLMSGKWHQAGNPVQRGFNRYFGHLSGACNFFTGDNTFRLDDQEFEVPKSGFYTTDANTDYALEFLKERPANKPFFLYLAYNAPHYPLHAPQAEVEKYRGKYKDGWDALRKKRLARMKQLGIIDDRSPLSPRPDDVPAWESLGDKEQDQQELCMAAYAGMIDRVDQNIGRLVDYLEEDRALENTLILFFSDNGACPFQRTTEVTRKNNLMPWDPKSYWTYDKGWGPRLQHALPRVQAKPARRRHLHRHDRPLAGGDQKHREDHAAAEPPGRCDGHLHRPRQGRVPSAAQRQQDRTLPRPQPAADLRRRDSPARRAVLHLLRLAQRAAQRRLEAGQQGQRPLGAVRPVDRPLGAQGPLQRLAAAAGRNEGPVGAAGGGVWDGEEEGQEEEQEEGQEEEQQGEAGHWDTVTGVEGVVGRSGGNFLTRRHEEHEERKW